MGDKGQVNRQRIVEAASQLFYRKGYNQTSFTDIASAAGLPRGNFYYYFKTKDDILQAVIQARLDDLRGRLLAWEAEHPQPRERIRRFARIAADGQQDVLRYGCPIGTLNVELSKTQTPLQAKAGAMFDLFADWLETQLAAMGRDDARQLALHLLARVQGLTLVANAFSDSAFLKRETADLERWVDAL